MNNHESISPALIDDVCAKLSAGKAVRQSLPGGGKLHIDRPLPFLCVYRRNPDRVDNGTDRFVMSEAAYLVAPGTAPSRPGLRQLVKRIAETVAAELGSFLILELWTSQHCSKPSDADSLTGELVLPQAHFSLMTRRPHRPEGTVSSFEYALQRVRLHRQPATVSIDLNARNHPPGMTQLMSSVEENRLGCHVLGMEMKPVFRDAVSNEVYDSVAGTLRRQVSRAIKKAVFSFSLNRTSIRPEHYFSLGSSRLAAQVTTVDRQLADVSSQFRFLLLVTPINAQRSWHEFADSGYRRAPTFCYRPLDADPMLLKRRLLRIATERVEDPTLAYVMRETQIELDRQLTMLMDIGTSRFLPGSLQVFGGVDGELSQLANEILSRLPRCDEVSSDREKEINAHEFAQLANSEISHYRTQSSKFEAEAVVRPDTYSGLLVSGNRLYIGHETTMRRSRAEALIQHEVGTHLVTYYNGAAQPLRLLKVGLAGYDAFQEGLAVLAEYLVGGLTNARIRTLAARVIAADRVIHGYGFTDVFQELVDAHGFQPSTAYTITMRIFRGGGFTKDAIYLRGLVEVLQYLGKSKDMLPLLVGKIASSHIPITRELLLRRVLTPPAIRPRFLDSELATNRLAKITPTTTVLDLFDIPNDAQSVISDSSSASKFVSQ